VLRRFPEVRSIHWSVNETPAEVTNLPTTLLWGDEAIEEALCGLRFRVRPNAFLQTNTAMAERLYGLAGEYAALTGNETVYDLYCGIGTIGLTLASKALTVWGVEVSEESVACALENADLNGISNAAFFAGEVGASLEELRDRAGAPDVAVVDPPRAGLSNKALRRLGRLESSTSRATPRRWRATSRSSRRSGATRSSGHGPSTCSRTRRTSRPSRSSLGPDLLLHRLAQLAEAVPQLADPLASEPRLDRLGVGAEAGPSLAEEPLSLVGEAHQVRPAVVGVRDSLSVPARLEPPDPEEHRRERHLHARREGRRRPRPLGPDHHVHRVVLRRELEPLQRGDDQLLAHLIRPEEVEQDRVGTGRGH
jgi:hypothetical protein